MRLKQENNKPAQYKPPPHSWKLLINCSCGCAEPELTQLSLQLCHGEFHFPPAAPKSPRLELHHREWEIQLRGCCSQKWRGRMRAGIRSCFLVLYFMSCVGNMDSVTTEPSPRFSLLWELWISLELSRIHLLEPGTTG